MTRPSPRKVKALPPIYVVVHESSTFFTHDAVCLDMAEAEALKCSPRERIVRYVPSLPRKVGKASRPRVFACATCGGRWDYPMGVHTFGGVPTASRWCKDNAREVLPRKAGARRAR